MSGNLGFAVGSPDGREGFVYLLFAPDADGAVRVHVWGPGNPAGPPAERTATVDELVAQVDRWRREKWSFTESPLSIAAWLRAPR